MTFCFDVIDDVFDVWGFFLVGEESRPNGCLSKHCYSLVGLKAIVRSVSCVKWPVDAKMSRQMIAVER